MKTGAKLRSASPVALLLLLLPACSVCQTCPCPVADATIPASDRPATFEAAHQGDFPISEVGSDGELLPVRVLDAEPAPVFNTGPVEDRSSELLLQPPADEAGWREITLGLAGVILEDYSNFYSVEGLLLVGLGVGLAAPLANTQADQGIRDWYQERVRNVSLDRTADFFKPCGDWRYSLAVYIGSVGVGALFPDRPAGAFLETWAWRSLRALAVGAPMNGMLQWGLGSGRPSNFVSSYWRPFYHDNASSGHAFVGAVPFLTAALMVENPWLKGALVGGSLVPGWTRINDDEHYFSQVILGWWIGFLATESVFATDRDRAYRFMPMTPNGEPGLGVQVEF